LKSDLSDELKVNKKIESKYHHSVS